MKYLPLLIIAGLWSQILRAQEPPEYLNSIRLGLVPIARGAFQLSYERSLPGRSVVLIGEITSYKVGGKEIRGQMGELQFRFNVSEKTGFSLFSLDGDVFYTTPFLSFRNKKITDSNYDDQITTTAVGLLFGIRFSNPDRLVLDVNFGAGNKWSTIETLRMNNGTYDDSILSPGYSGVYPAGNITFGIKF